MQLILKRFARNRGVKVFRRLKIVFFENNFADFSQIYYVCRVIQNLYPLPIQNYMTLSVAHRLIQRMFPKTRDPIAFHWLIKHFLKQVYLYGRNRDFRRLRTPTLTIFFDSRKTNEPICDRGLNSLIG